MGVLIPQHQRVSVNRALCKLRTPVASRGAVALRAEPSTAVLKQTDASVGEAALEHDSEHLRHTSGSGALQASTLEEHAQVAPHPEGSSASEGNVPWKRSRQDGRDGKTILERHQFRCKVGDVVVGKVVYSGEKGAKVDLLDHPGVMGFMPADRGPYAIHEPYMRQNSRTRIAVGTTRKFQVLTIPSRMEVNGKGPLLCCQGLDVSLLWRRLEQVFDECLSTRALVTVRIHGSSKGGLLCSLCGIRGFIPISHIPKPSTEMWWDQEALEEQYMGKSVEVALLEIKRDKNTFTCSLRLAEATRALKSLRVGSLVWGTVRLVRSYGAFIAIDDTNESALLHIGNISWERVYDVEEHLAVGDRVRSVIIGMDEDYSRLSVSTKDLEITPGDMLINKEAVYENAEEGVKPFLRHVAEWEAQAASHQGEQEWHDSFADTLENEEPRK